MKIALTIGMATFDDFQGVYFTVQALRLYHRDALARCELIVVDNNPTSQEGTMTRNLIENWVKGDFAAVRYVMAPETVGTSAPRDRVFREAAGEAVVCMDAHVMLPPGVLSRLLDYYAANQETRDLLSGPMLYDDLHNRSTHFQPEWRAEMWGVWGTDERAFAAGQEAFEIPGQGLGFFTCRKAAWLGFNPHFRGFGGEELYIHEKFRQAGAKALCLPWLQWVHRFGRPGGVAYPLTRWNKVRNYVIGHRELGLPLDPIHAHFVAGNLMAQADWDFLLSADPPPLSPAKTEQFSVGGCGGCSIKAEDLDAAYKAAAETPSDINEHCETLRRLAAESEHVTEFGVRHGVSTVALLAGRPKRMASYDMTKYPEVDALGRLAGDAVDFRFVLGDSLSVDIEETDLLFIDTKHTANQLLGELSRHAPKVRRRIAMHDTQIFGETGDDGGPGLLPALRLFMRQNPEWSVVEHHLHNYGFTVISRDPRDKKALPGKIAMAANLAVAIAKHVADGLSEVPAAVLDSRLEICTLCDQRTDDRCGACGCFLAAKAGMATSECPLGKWPAIQPAAQGEAA